MADFGAAADANAGYSARAGMTPCADGQQPRGLDSSSFALTAHNQPPVIDH